MTRRFFFLASCIAIAACGAPGLEPGEGFVDVTGGQVWYRISGSGTAMPLILLHGGPGFPSYYLKPLEPLADERPVINNSYSSYQLEPLADESSSFHRCRQLVAIP